MSTRPPPHTHDHQYAFINHTHGDPTRRGDGGPLTIDHGSLTGTGDDDHTQYLLRSILTTQGDLLVQGASAAERLAKGTDGQVLKMVSGAPAWDTDATGGGGGGSVDESDDFDWTGDHTFSETLEANGGITTTGGDPFWDDVVALLHFEGSDGSTTFTDAIGTSWTPSGNAQIDTAQFKYGSSALLLDGTGDFISTADSTSYTLGAGDFTVECFARFNAIPTAGQFCGFMNHYSTSASQRSWIFGYSGSSGLMFLYNTNGGTSPGNIQITSAWTPSTATWYHVAACRSGNTVYLFVDGTLLGTGDVTGVTIKDPSTDLEIGRGGDSEYFNGWLDEVRITRAARYTTGFTSPTDAFVETGGGVLHLDCEVLVDGPLTCGAASVVDLAVSGDTSVVDLAVSGDTFVGPNAASLSPYISGLVTTDEALYGDGSIALFNQALQPSLSMVRVNGTYGSPTAVSNNNGMFQLSGYGYFSASGGGITRSSCIDALATQDFTNTAAGTRLRIRVCPTASTTLVEAVSIRSDSLLIPVVAGDPTTLSNGMIWYNSSTHKLMVRANGTSVAVH